MKNLKYGIGPIGFIGNVFEVYHSDINSEIPAKFIVHGSIIPSKERDINIIGFYKDYYLIKYKSINNKYVTLGFDEDSLESCKGTVFNSINMKINDLKKKHPRIYDKILERRKEQGNSKIPNDTDALYRDKSQGNFSWINTKEGTNFRRDIDKGVFINFYKMYPISIDSFSII
jgi:hypothetical protein